MSETVSPKYAVGDIIRNTRGGKGRWRVDAVDMSAGVYTYTCIADVIGSPSTYQARVAFHIADDENSFVRDGTRFKVGDWITEGDPDTNHMVYKVLWMVAEGHDPYYRVLVIQVEAQNDFEMDIAMWIIDDQCIPYLAPLPPVPEPNPVFRRMSRRVEL